MERTNRRRLTGNWITKARESRLPRRIAFYCLGLFLIAFGVTVAVNSTLGVSPTSALVYVLSRVFSPSMGTFTALLLTFLVLLQILILRGEFKWINLTQLFAAASYGYFIDLSRFLLGDFRLHTYFGQLAMQGVSFILIALGIALVVELRLVVLPVEGLADAIGKKFLNGSFHRGKIIVDCSLTFAALALSLLFLNGLYGAREGTILSAILVGKLLPYTQKIITILLPKVGICFSNTP